MYQAKQLMLRTCTIENQINMTNEMQKYYIHLGRPLKRLKYLDQMDQESSQTIN